MKKCCHCNRYKEETEFKKREDSWGLYSWCNDCIHKEGRDQLLIEQDEFIEKTRMFT